MIILLLVLLYRKMYLMFNSILLRMALKHCYILKGRINIENVSFMFWTAWDTMNLLYSQKFKFFFSVDVISLVYEDVQHLCEILEKVHSSINASTRKSLLL